jgi:hypothetical protein
MQQTSMQILFETFLYVLIFTIMATMGNFEVMPAKSTYVTIYSVRILLCINYNCLYIRQYNKSLV